MSRVEISVLGPFQVRVGNVDVTHRLSASGCGLLAVLAANQGPVGRDELRRSVALAASSLDPQLSKLTAVLDRPVHRSRWPRAGYVGLDRDVAGVDADRFLAAGEAAERAVADGRWVDAVDAVLAGDQLWRGPPFADLAIVAADPEGTAPTTETARSLLRIRRRSCELAATAWVRRSGPSLGAERLARWARELVDSQTCWFAAVCATLDEEGISAAEALLAVWAAPERESGPRAVAVRLVDECRRSGSGATTNAPGLVQDRRGGLVGDLVAMAERAESRFEYLSAIDLTTAALERSGPLGRAPIRRLRAEAHRLCGNWDAAESDYLAAADDAHALGDPVREAEVTLAMARITWDVDRFGGRLRERLLRLLAELPPEEAGLRAAVGACLAGGDYQSGEVDTGAGQRHARRALELLDGFDDPAVAAQVLFFARKALVDLDPPALQLERARRIQVLGAGSEDLRRLGDLAVLVDLLLLGRTEEARVATEAHRQVVERTRATLHRYHQAAIDAMWALHDGDWAAAAASIARADEIGRPFGRDTVAQVVGGQRLWLAWQTGDVAVQEVMLAGISASGAPEVSTPVWRCGAALIQVGLGQIDEATTTLHRLAASSNRFADLPRGPHRLAVLALATEAAAGVVAAGAGAEAAALQPLGSALRTELEAHPAGGVLIGWPTLYLGSKRRFEGLAAFVAGDVDTAAERLQAAIAQDEASPAIAARCRADLAMVAAARV